MAQFQHPNIVRVHHFFEAHGTAYIVMDYVEGEDLSAYLARQGTLSGAELKGILYPLLDGLAVVHKAGFLHRDITPGNIVIRAEDGSPVLIDFGAARQAIGTRSFSVIRTSGYAPIEQYERRSNQGPWTDLYALGAVCYRALTGRVPKEATDRVRHDPLVPVSQQCAGQASQGFLSAIDAALSVYGEDRPQSVATWREALEASGEPQTRRQAKGQPRRYPQTQDPQTQDPQARHQVKGQPRREQATERLPLPTPANLVGERERFVVEVGHKPSPDAVDDEGMTDLHYAAKLNLPALTLYLLSLGAAVDARNDDKGTGLTPLHFAAYWDASATAEVLLRLGAVVDAVNDSVEGLGEMPLHFAAENDASSTAEILIRHGADVHARSYSREKPLHWAARYNAFSTAEVLLRHGADVRAKNYNGDTPLHFAAENDASSTASVLRRYGARE